MKDHSTTIPAGKCLACGAPAEIATSPDDRRPNPEPGSFTVCLQCGDVAAFDEKLKLRPLTPEEAATAKREPEILLIKAAINAMKAAAHSNLRREPPGDAPISELFVVLARDKDGNDGIVGTFNFATGVTTPLFTSKRRLTSGMLEMAVMAPTPTARRIRLVRFVLAEVMQEVESPGTDDARKN